MQRAFIAITAITAALVSAALAVSAVAATKTVTVKDDFFAPKSISVARGSTIKWIWRGDEKHNVTVRSGPTKFHSPTQRTGRFSKRLTTRGTYKIICTIHAPSMAMTIKVR